MAVKQDTRGDGAQRKIENQPIVGRKHETPARGRKKVEDWSARDDQRTDSVRRPQQAKSE